MGGKWITAIERKIEQLFERYISYHKDNYILQLRISQFIVQSFSFLSEIVKKDEKLLKWDFK